MFFKRLKSNNVKKYSEFDSYWVQNTKFNRMDNRVEYFKDICRFKKILHVGCTDWPIFDSKNNLHIQLSEVAKELCGFDIDKSGLKNLSKYVRGKYFSDFSEIGNEMFDICLVPETIEHVENVQLFLKELATIKAQAFYITAPNCFSEENIKRNCYVDNEFIEIVHPDHNCWFSPFTLKNVIQKYSNLIVDEVFLLEQDRMICCVARHAT